MGMEHNQRTTLYTLIITLLTMGIEIVAGFISHSMALTVDAWHLSMDSVALLITWLTYQVAKQQGNKERTLAMGGLVNGLLLLVTSVLLFFESLQRFFTPVEVHFNLAISVTVIGLFSNLLCAWLLRPKEHEHHDLNLKGSYIHMVSDFATSVIAIIALTLFHYTQDTRWDALAGGISSVLILWWAVGLLRDAKKELSSQ